MKQMMVKYQERKKKRDLFSISVDGGGDVTLPKRPEKSDDGIWYK